MTEHLFLTDRIVELGREALQHHRDFTLPFLQKNIVGHSTTSLVVDWHSLRLRFRRRAGHTTAALRLLAKVPESIMVVPCRNETSRDRLWRQVEDPLARKRITQAQVHPTPFDFQRFQGCPLVIIDDAISLRDDRTYDGLAEAIHHVAPEAFYLLLG